MFTQLLFSPIGNIEIEASDLGITRINFLLNNESIAEQVNEHTQKACRQLEEYFQGKRREFELKFDLESASVFQKTVWKALLDIPFGQTISYAELSNRINNPKAIRAVGAANGKNPIAIVIPCHRVIGSDGSLTGYASGIDIKAKLLMHENPKVFGRQSVLF